MLRPVIGVIHFLRYRSSFFRVIEQQAAHKLSFYVCGNTSESLAKA